MCLIKVKKYLSTVPYIGSAFKMKPMVSVVRMAGVIADSSQMKKAGISYQKFSKLLDKAFDVPDLKALALVINSPGGAPVQCALISSQIRKLSEEKEVPVYAFVEDVAASGGYWLACSGDKIFAQKSSIVGSIGVISASFGLDEFIKKYGISRRVYTSGKDKSFLDSFLPEKPNDILRLKKLQAGIHEDFKNWVKDRRGDVLKGSDKDLMEGAFWTGADALDKGLIDDIGDVSGVMKEMFGEDTKFIEFAPDKKWLPSFLPFGAARSSLHGDVIIDALDAIETRGFWARYGL
ncbi:MAG: S49 family peptidase [Alphaproteobacteria bacterium]|nr:S49 family peptidase [Alphaproteobacteria bacterium]NCQ88318.1 S49 family peptidase [Alphaproteobacteria bacterium]NCT05174.1 S49 family peptidase [Alphaproteobacteria bacterium]